MDIPPTAKKVKYSFVYRNLFAYRLILNILFLGRYKQRFKKVIVLLDPKQEKKVIELCFGDIYIAQWCQKQGLDYIGFDINPHFISVAKKKGYCVNLADLRDQTPIPAGDVAIMMGSLYHFHDILGELVDKVMASCTRFIISEPIKNWASRDDVFGRIARNSANAGQGEEFFRFNEHSLIEALEKISRGRYNISHTISGKEAIVDICRK
ncbi:MAG: hypothetical protein PHV62_08410 [Sulfuricurvum sp.]|nr:hypothetical protein [Sulfuricurvum sp.]